jgi:hypothetical protein
MGYTQDIDQNRLAAAHGQRVAATGNSVKQLNKTADYTIQAADLSTGFLVLTNYGAAGAVIFTLPTPAAALVGARVRTIGFVDQNVTLTAPVADTLVTLHDIAADSLAASTASQKIGSVLEAMCIQTAASTYQWAAFTVSNGTTGTAAT